MRWWKPVLLVWAAVGCSAFAQDVQVPLAETAEGGGPGGGTFFVVQALEGKDVDTNALRESVRASFGRGACMKVVPYARTCPPGGTLKALDAARRVRGVLLYAPPALAAGATVASPQ